MEQIKNGLKIKDKYMEYKNNNLLKKEVLRETFVLTSEINNLNLIENLKKEVIAKINIYNLHNKTAVDGKQGHWSMLNNSSNFHSFIKSIKKDIKKIYFRNFILYNSWGNIYKKGEGCRTHSHSGNTAFCGILYLTENGPGTYFKDYDITIEEKIGRFVLFHPFLDHSVKKLDKDIERITIAFNMNQCKEWENYSDKNNYTIEKL